MNESQTAKVLFEVLKPFKSFKSVKKFFYVIAATLMLHNLILIILVL